MKKFAFISKAAAQEYMDLPVKIQDEFGKDLRKIQRDQPTKFPTQQLSGMAVAAIELKINGSPAYRCVYVTKYFDTVIVLHSFEKTTNGPDRAAMEVVKDRIKDLRKQIAQEAAKA